MRTLIVSVPADRITSRESFQSVFQDVFGFVEFYGRNFDAWMDWMTCLDDPRAELSRVTVSPGERVAIRIDDVEEFRRRCSDLFDTRIEMTAFVSWRRIKKGEPPLLTLLLSGAS